METFWNEASQLAKHSLRLRALLPVLHANRNRTLTPEMQSKLTELLAEVRLERELANPIDGSPIPITQREAVRYLAHRLYLRSARYRDQTHQADTAGLDPDVAEFVQAFMRMMANIGIPTHADIAFQTRGAAAAAYVLGLQSELDLFTTGRAFTLVHSIRGRKLPAICWGLFAHVGHEVGRKLGLGVNWGGHSAPWQWVVDP